MIRKAKYVESQHFFRMINGANLLRVNFNECELITDEVVYQIA